MRLESGVLAPGFELLNQFGESINLESFKAKVVVLYFYPKDATSGCSTQNRQFNELLDAFSERNAIPLGISPDSVESHAKFAKKEGLRQILLSDADKIAAQNYGVFVEKSMYGRRYMGILRSSFVIVEGRIHAAFYNVKSSDNAQKMLEIVGKI